MSEEAQTVADVQTETAPLEGDRPDWLAEKFNTPQDLANAYTNLESKLGQSEDSIRDSILEEYEQVLNDSRPASAGEYELPESIDPELANENELLQWWANEAWENGYSQEEFDDGIAQYAGFIQSQQPDLDAERANLGENATARIDAANAWANSFFPEELHGAFLMMGQTAVGIKALEYMQSQTKQSAMNGTAEASPQITIDDVRSMQADPRYHDPVRRDRAFVAKVDEAYAKLFPS